MMLKPSNFTMNARADIVRDISDGTDPEMGIPGPVWQVILANVPCRLLKDARFHYGMSFTGPGEQPTSESLFGFNRAITLDLELDTIRYNDPLRGARLFKPMGINDVHQMGILTVIEGREAP